MARKWMKALGILVAGAAVVVGSAILLGQYTVAITIPLMAILGGRLIVRAITGSPPNRGPGDDSE